MNSVTDTSEFLININTTRFAALLVCLSITSACLTPEIPPDAAVAVETGAVAARASNNAANAAPVIAGSPGAAVLAGDNYAFTPSANDPDGDTLVFTIANKPRWAKFDSKTGRLSGQTLLGDVGTYDKIRISVSDGNASRSLPEFSITVSQVALGSMSLSWTAPTQNTDGSVLTDLAGYKLYYGKSAGRYNKSIRIDNPSVTSYLIDNLLPGTYYVVATSFNALGIESAFSNEAIKTVTSN